MIHGVFGIQHDDSKMDILCDVMQERQRSTGIASDSAYIEFLRRSPGEQEAVARRITISETYFFRIPEQFDALMRTVLPERMRSLDRRSIRILSCGCSSGEEAYTIAMLIADRRAQFPAVEFEITGVDLNPNVVEIARAGVYSPWSLRATTEYFRHKYFDKRGNSYALKEGIRNAVSFREHNLFQAPLAESFDVIFFRNVLIYFSPETAHRAIDNIEAMIAADGYLFLGPAETLRGLSNRYEIIHTEGAFYYQHCGEAPPPQPRVLSPPIPMPSWEAPTAAPSEEWFDNIQRSATRIQGLLQQSPAKSPSITMRSAAQQAEEREVQPTADPEELTLLAVAQLNEGNARAAEKSCAAVLEISNMDAGAHYLMALCREQRGDISGAIQHDEIASYLDPTFSMPPLHKGMLACRSGDLEDGRRSLKKSLELLPTEDSARILLLGGGFHRQSLIQLCKRELAKCGRSQA